MPNSLLRLLQINSDKVATSLKCNAHVFYFILVVSVSLTLRRRRYSIDLEYTSVRLPLVENKKTEIKDKEGVVEKNLS